MENSLELPQKTDNRTTIWSSNSTAGYTSEDSENSNLFAFIFKTNLFLIEA